MKTMQNFSAQQLSKKQMNEVKGGDIICTVRYRDKDGNMIKEEGPIGGANNTAEAALQVENKYTSIGYECISVYC